MALIRTNKAPAASGAEIVEDGYVLDGTSGAITPYTSGTAINLSTSFKGGAIIINVKNISTIASMKTNKTTSDMTSLVFGIKNNTISASLGNISSGSGVTNLDVTAYDYIMASIGTNSASALGNTTLTITI